MVGFCSALAARWLRSAEMCVPSEPRYLRGPKLMAKLRLIHHRDMNEAVDVFTTGSFRWDSIIGVTFRYANYYLLLSYIQTDGRDERRGLYRTIIGLDVIVVLRRRIAILAPASGARIRSNHQQNQSRKKAARED